MRDVLTRIRCLPSQINGLYLWQLEECCGRATYKHSVQPLWIYYHEKRGAWCVGDAVKSTAPHAYIEDDRATPDRCNGAWHVFTRGRHRRKSSSGQVDPKGKGRYEPDTAIECLRKSVLEGTQPLTEKARHIVRAAHYLRRVTRFSIFWVHVGACPTLIPSSRLCSADSSQPKKTL
jgi:hypothetical protein